MPMQIMVNGIQRDATPEEEAAFLAALPKVEPPKPATIDRLTFWLAAADIGVTKKSVISHAQSAYEQDPRALAKALAFIEEASFYRREDPILGAMAALEGITEDHLDALWAWASLSV